MRRKILALAAAVAIGTATMTTGAMAFGHGGGGGQAVSAAESMVGGGGFGGGASWWRLRWRPFRRMAMGHGGLATGAAPMDFDGGPRRFAGRGFAIGHSGLPAAVSDATTSSRLRPFHGGLYDRSGRRRARLRVWRPIAVLRPFTATATPTRLVSLRHHDAPRPATGAAPTSAVRVAHSKALGLDAKI